MNTRFVLMIIVAFIAVAQIFYYIGWNKGFNAMKKLSDEYYEEVKKIISGRR